MLLGPAEAPDKLAARVAIVGSGPAGLAAAIALGEAGVDVVVLEAGLAEPDPFATSLAAAASAPENHVKLEDIGGRRLGGASWTWGGRCVAYDAVDFEPRPGADAPSWPITRAEVTREAPRAADLLGIGSADFGAPPHPALKDAALPIMLERWCAEPRLMKSAGRALRQARGIRVQLGAACTGVEISGQGHVEALSARTADGRSVRVEADAYVLAAGGIDTARLLLWAYERLPAHARSPWLGRGYMGHLGGALTALVAPRPLIRALDYFRAEEGCFARRRIGLDPETARAQGLLNIAFHIDNPPMRDPQHRAAGLSAMALALAAPGLGAALAPKIMRDVFLGPPLTREETLAHVANVIRSPWTAAAFAARAVAGRATRPVRPGIVVPDANGRYALSFYAEQTAQRAGGVTLSETTDALGLPRVEIRRPIAESDVESVVRAHDWLDARLRALGLGRLEPIVPRDAWTETILARSGDGYHQIGLTRMSGSPATGVVDADARVHGVDNLFVAGSAVFPTGSQANPTFLIVCQSLRLAAHLAEKVVRGAR